MSSFQTAHRVRDCEHSPRTLDFFLSNLTLNFDRILMCSNQKEIEEKLEAKINIIELRKKVISTIYEEIGSEYLSPAGRFNVFFSLRKF